MPRLDPLYFARTGVSQGLSGRQAYAQMMQQAQNLTEASGERWTGVARDTFFQVYSGVRNTREQIPVAMNAPKDVVLGGLTPSERPSTVSGRYLYGTVAFTRPIGSPEVERSIHLIQSKQALTPQQVEDEVRRQIEESAMQSHGTFTNYTIEGISFTGVERLTGGL